MNCQGSYVTYTIVRGDTLNKIAARHDTTPVAILHDNPGLDPRNLRIGQVLSICIAYDTMAVSGSHRTGISPEYVMLQNRQRTLWEQHVMYTRMVIMTIADSLSDDAEVTKRILQNPQDFANLYRKYYGDNVARHIAELWTEHLVIAKEMFQSLKKGKSEAAAEAEKRWYENARDIAEYYSTFNPFYNRDMLEKMMFAHLDIVKKEFDARLAKRYTDDIAAYDEGERQALGMADFFSQGIAKQKSSMFS